jgi:hypothetical protein
MTTQEDIARVIWSRFAPGHRESWEDETHKAEYMDTAKQIMSLGAPCVGCDGHECDDGCAYPGAANTSGDRN